MASKLPSLPSRGLERKRVLMVATLFTCDGAQRVRVRDLTPAGAQLQLDSSVSPGSDVIFKRGNLFAAAHIAWTKDCWAGIRFYRTLSQFISSDPEDTLLMFLDKFREPAELNGD
jgi:hypothetical protein